MASKTVTRSICLAKYKTISLCEVEIYRSIDLQRINVNHTNEKIEQIDLLKVSWRNLTPRKFSQFMSSHIYMNREAVKVIHRSCLCQACSGLLKLLTWIDYENTIKQISPLTLASLIFQISPLILALIMFQRPKLYETIRAFYLVLLENQHSPFDDTFNDICRLNCLDLRVKQTVIVWLSMASYHSPVC